MGTQRWQQATRLPHGLEELAPDPRRLRPHVRNARPLCAPKQPGFATAAAAAAAAGGNLAYD